MGYYPGIHSFYEISTAEFGFEKFSRSSEVLFSYFSSCYSSSKGKSA